MAIVRHLSVLLLLIPACLHSQTTAQGAWYTTIGEVRATLDGWVEWRIENPTSIPPHFDEYGGIVVRLPPDSARRWIAAVRGALADSTSTAEKTTTQISPMAKQKSRSRSIAIRCCASGMRYRPASAVAATACRLRAPMCSCWSMRWTRQRARPHHCAPRLLMAEPVPSRLPR